MARSILTIEAFAAVTAAVLSCGGQVRGQADAETGGGVDAQPKPENRQVDEATSRFFERFDKNSDDRITKDEAATRWGTLARFDKNEDEAVDREEFRQAWRRQVLLLLGKRFDSQDKNGDGQLDKAEAASSPFAGSFDRADIDGDGLLEKDELEKGFAKGVIRMGETRPRNLSRAAVIQRLFTANDANADGKITQAEARPVVRKNFAQFDQNGDGVVDRSEFEAVAGFLGPGPGAAGPVIDRATISKLEERYWPSRPRRSTRTEGDPLTAEEVPGDGVWLDPTLRRVTAPTFPVTVWFDQQVLGDGQAYARRCQEFSDQPRRALRAKMVRSLKAVSERSFQAAEASVAKLVDEDKIQLVEWHWVVNGFSCLSTRDGLKGLQDTPGVKKIFLARGRLPALASDDRQPGFAPEVKRKVAGAQFQRPWYVRYLQADKAWQRLGVTGEGVLNVVLDGNFVLAPSVNGNVYRNSSEVPGNGKDDDGNGWVDDYHGFNFLRDDALLTARELGSPPSTGDLHGFLCAAIICGTGAEDSPYAFGLAPQASWAGLVAGGRIEPAMEWAIEHEADTLSMSFSRPGLGEYRSHWRKVMEHASLCGVYCVSGAGNFAREGSRSYAPTPQQLRTPEDIPAAVFAAAGVQRNLGRTTFSSQGPVQWETEHYRDGRVSKPDFCAFNMDLPRLLPDGEVQTTGASGNSFAGPMLAGSLALMISADPDLLPWRAREILASTTTDVAAPGFDPQTGHGLINCYRAVKEVLRRRRVREGADAEPFTGREDDDALDPDALRKRLARQLRVVRAVRSGSVASQHGIRVGDVAESIDGQPIESIETVRAAIKKAVEQEATKIVLVVRRDGDEHVFELPVPEQGVIGIALRTQYEEPVFK